MNENSENQDFKFVPFLKTFSQVDVAMIKSILDGHIQYYFKDENFMSVRPLLEPAILMVREDQYAEVKELLNDFELNYLGVSIKGEDEEESGE
jgi:hypothetical protein